MGLHEITARFIATVKDMLDLEPQLGSTTLVSQFAELKLQVVELQGLLEETHRALKEKDELIAKLQAAEAARESVAIVEPAAAEEGDRKPKPQKTRKRSPRPCVRDQKK
ncbi:MAG: hypothetical protein A2Y76_13120 [Planctomycetes bacterium RBG_13_60_9]|nr:MAG: hypothetical protein A2Y76_13120 [Planctomycetes bacterium RBG_13_60_9]